MQSVWADGPLSTLINRIESAETESNVPLVEKMKDPAMLKMKLFKKLPKYLGKFGPFFRTDIFSDFDDTFSQFNKLIFKL